MRIRFLLGPAGSGKTHRCLGEIRDELRRAPAGLPLLLLAPKQATFQVERALLEDDALTGWSRLQILSFERLARQILGESGPLDLLTEEGRLMVLRALLREHQPELRIFRSSARLAGFAQELSTALRELQSHQLGPTRLEALAARVTDLPALPDKLHDLALLLRAYHRRLEARQLTDVDRLAELAAEALRDGTSTFRLQAVWLDGFAEMTPQEIELLAAVAARSQETTLAFCVDREYREDAPWRSTWSVVSQTLRRCHARLASLPDAAPEVSLLPVHPETGRFRNEPALAHLAAAWSAPAPAVGPALERAPAALRLVACRDTEREAVVAAREIRRHVRAGGRFRDVAILLRSLDVEAPVWQRVLLRYDIPHFLDRREPLAHHPLAELTRGALRLAAFDWPAEDWFGILKTGLTPVPAERLDAWENLALARGWDGSFWQRAAADPPPELARQSALLEELTGPFRRFLAELGTEPSARLLATALRQLWEDLGVRARLDDWGAATDPTPGSRPGSVEATSALHRAAWEQLAGWLDSFELGFGDEPAAVADWLPVVEAGLAALTAGVIPPAQDQVLVGAIDRSRQPELKLAIVAGLNEGVFPAVPREGGLLSEVERQRLGDVGAPLGPDRRRRVGHERYYGYIACTRSGARLVLTWSQRDARGRPLNASPFVGQILALFPGLATVTDDAEEISREQTVPELAARAIHAHELLPWLLARPGPTPLDGLAGDTVRRAWLRQCRERAAGDHLTHAAVRGLHGIAPEITVSALESLAACPFQFFARHGLQAKEREQLELDPRRAGTLAHHLLARFHETVTRSGRRWRDLAPDEARQTLKALAETEIATTAHGLFAHHPEARWHAAQLVESLAEFVATLVRWMATYAFDPTRAELAFGGRGPLPAWPVDSDRPDSLRLRGTVDRVDCLRTDGGPTPFVVIDYKLKLPRYDDTLAEAGIAVQLPAYMLALAEQPTGLVFESSDLAPAGMFYLGLRGRPARTANRREQPNHDAVRATVHVHRGRFSAAVADALDTAAAVQPSGQFALRRNKDGALRKGGDGRSAGEFSDLLERIRDTMRRLDDSLRSGRVSPDPYRHKNQKACDQCEIASVCRFDPWLQPFRSLADRGAESRPAARA